MSFSCMLSHGFHEDRIKSWPVAVEQKYDGVRCLMVIEPGETKCTAYSRAGKEFTSVYTICNQIEKLYAALGAATGLVLDGELDCGTFKETVSRVRRKNQEADTAVFKAFDWIEYAEWQSGQETSLRWEQRRVVLEYLVEEMNTNRIAVSEYFKANSMAEIMDAFADVLADGGEGLIVKDRDGRYFNGRTHGWMKIKDEKSEDLKVIGVFEGGGRLEGTAGGIIVDFNGVEVRVGTGFKDVDRHAIWADQESVIGKTAEVTYHEQTPYGSLRHPAFKGFRIDK